MVESAVFEPWHFRLHLQLFGLLCAQKDVRNGARCTNYLTIILQLSYDNAKVTIDLRRSVVRFTKYLTENAGLFLGTIHLKNRKFVWDNVCK